MLQSGSFSVDDPATIPKEAEFRSGGDLKIGGTLIQASSREIKKNIVEVNPAGVLDHIGALPIYQWTYAHNSDHIRHMGPMSENFYALFGLGDTNKGIAGVDSSGVALAAIQALQQANTELNDRIRMLETKLAEMDELKQQMVQVLALKGDHQFARVVSD